MKTTLFWALFPALLLARTWEPDVRFASGRLIATPGEDQSVVTSKMEVLETETCAGPEVSKSSITLPERCTFLRGLFDYSFTHAARKQIHRHLMEFTVTRGPQGSYTLLVAAPVLVQMP